MTAGVGSGICVKAIERMLKVVREAALVAFSGIEYLGPLRTYPKRNFTAGELDPAIHDQAVWMKVMLRESLRYRVNQWLLKLGCHHQLHVGSVVSSDVLAAAFRKGMSEETRKYREEISAMRKEEDRGGTMYTQAYEAMEHWESEEAIENAISRALQTTVSPGSRTLQLKDERNGADVSFRDIGLGTSQMLPIVISALSNRNKLIAIEQPEIHLHPALQAELGDLFIESALGENGNHFILETHSEHLILRIMRRIRETTSGKLPNGLPPLS